MGAIGPIIHAGELRHRVSILQDQGTQNALGEKIPNWQSAWQQQAAIVPVSGKLAERLRAIVPTCTHQVTLRYHAGILPGMRVGFGSRVFNIMACLNEDERNIRLNLVCVEEPGGGAA